MAFRAQADKDASNAYPDVKAKVFALATAYDKGYLYKWRLEKLKEHKDYLDKAWAWSNDSYQKTSYAGLDKEIEGEFDFGLLELRLKVEEYMETRRQAAASMHAYVSVVDTVFKAHAARLQKEGQQ